MRRLALLLLLAGCAAPVPEAGPPAADAPPPPLDRLEVGVHAEANVARRRAGRPALAWDPALAALALGHSRDMARRGFFDHVSPGGEDAQDRALRGGVRCRKDLGGGRALVGVSENLYMTTQYARRWVHRRGGRRTVIHDWMSADAIAGATVESWLRSRGHRRNLLDARARAHGVGVAVGPGHRVYVTQVLC